VPVARLQQRQLHCSEGRAKVVDQSFEGLRPEGDVEQLIAMMAQVDKSMMDTFRDTLVEERRKRDGKKRKIDEVDEDQKNKKNWSSDEGWEVHCDMRSRAYVKC
jgi:hypothetical protein